ncbi:universal stress protein [Winogradskyella aquimaris]|uniref:Universal stress protein n=1 Tax=Winogradskyella aquimaris TaxID=864074 RepID=A0ABU5EQX1_9FLAO|nr:universal stress protein [Winogradskyella aquimaris]MDY2587928.1 universal stress protein [Winogradskyella aquimaris]
MKNVLLPTDFSENSWNAIQYAIHFFKSTECHFYLLHVNNLNQYIPVDESLSFGTYHYDYTYADDTKYKLRRLMKRISKLGPNRVMHRFFVLSETGFFIDTIRNIVKERLIDFIVMGTKGASGITEFILGTNTADVITKVKCNTLAVPENSKFSPVKNIAFPTDLNLNYNIEVLQPLIGIIQDYESTVSILHNSKNNENLNRVSNENLALLKDYFSNVKSSFHHLNDEKLEDAVQHFVEDRAIDLICMVAKNLNYFQQLFFHSRVEKISYHTDKPLLVLHEKN